MSISPAPNSGGEVRAATPNGAEARARIMRAAERLFALKGFAATSVHEITDAAQVNRALLYYYFEDKHALYMSLLDEGTVEFTAMIDQALDMPGSYQERLAAFVRGHLELICRRGDHCRMIHRCLLDGQQDEFGLVQRFRTATARLVEFFRDGMAAGEFRAGDPEILARTVIGPTFVCSLWNIAEPEHFDLVRVGDEIERMLLHGLGNAKDECRRAKDEPAPSRTFSRDRESSDR